MNTQNTPSAGRGGLLDRPRPVVGGLVYSSAVVGMVLVSFLFSITVALISSATDTPVADLQATDAYKYLSYLVNQLLFLAVIFAFAFSGRQKPRDFGFRKVRPRYILVSLLLAFGTLFSFVQRRDNFGIRLYVDLVSRKSGGKFGVQTASADRKRQFVVRDYNARLLICFV